MPKNAFDHYNDACSYCLIAEHCESTELAGAAQQTALIEKALDQLRQSVAAGFTKFDYLKQDTALSILRDHPEFIELVDASESDSSEPSK